jgi:hypothetical protein
LITVCINRMTLLISLFAEDATKRLARGRRE